jgi:hypothetical membrane protein
MKIMNTLKLAGALLFLAGAIVLMGIITAETQYPTAYTTRNSEISDLGATRPPNSVSYQPSARIFDSTMLVAGVLIVITAFVQHKYFKKPMFSIPFILFGLGLAGVGIFPGNVSPYHGLSAMLAFLSGGVAAIMSFTIVSAPLKYIVLVLGSIALTMWSAAVFAGDSIFPIIGMGGAERWVAYPIMLWVTGFGGYLMNTTTLFHVSSTN